MFNPQCAHLEPTEQQSYAWTDEGSLANTQNTPLGATFLTYSWLHQVKVATNSSRKEIANSNATTHPLNS
jgi:hypothetical protein